MLKNKIKEENQNENDFWEFYMLDNDLIKGLEADGYTYVFKYFKDNWKKLTKEKNIIYPYFSEETEYKNIVLAIHSLNNITPHLFNIQCLIIFSSDSKAIEFYEVFSAISKKMKIKSGLIIEENSIIDDRNCLTKEYPEIIIGSFNRIDYVIKKHFLNVFMLKILILDINIRNSEEFKKETYEDILLMMPEKTKKTIFYEENQIFKKKHLKALEKCL